MAQKKTQQEMVQTDQSTYVAVSYRMKQGLTRTDVLRRRFGGTVQLHNERHRVGIM